MSKTAEVDAVIIRNLEVIELSHDRIFNEIEGRLSKEAAKIYEEVAQEARWITEATVLGEDFWLANSEWRAEDGDEKEVDYYLVVRTGYDSKQTDVSWTQTFVSGRLLLVLGSDPFTHKKWSTLLQSSRCSALIQRLIAASHFRYEPENKTEPLALPVYLDQESLAKAFAGEMDFEEALAPLSEALREIVRQDALLSELADLARQADA